MSGAAGIAAAKNRRASQDPNKKPIIDCFFSTLMVFTRQEGPYFFFLIDFCMAFVGCGEIAKALIPQTGLFGLGA